MNLNPVLVIPTYWASSRSNSARRRAGFVYDHMTQIDKEGTLGRCLTSLHQVVGLGRVILLVVSEPGIENQALEKVREIASQHNSLEIIVIGEPQLHHIHRQMQQLGIGAFTSSASLTGYGAIRNLGILAASIFGHDTVIFIDDDEVVLDSDFLENAVYGIAMQTPSGSLVCGKTGYFIDRQDSYLVPEDVPFWDYFWNKSRMFNEYISQVMAGPRLSRAQTTCGGCLVLHADLYGRVAFDPWIQRGEDLDYMLSAHMFNVDIWFDNKFYLQHIPPKTSSDVLRFEQDMGRWFYELRKIEFSKTQIDLMQIIPRTFDPYPGPWISPSVARRARFTALLRAIFCPEHKEYWNAATSTRKRASNYARAHCSKYFGFQHEWPNIVRALWDCTPLAAQLIQARIDNLNPVFTGRFTPLKKTDK